MVSWLNYVAYLGKEQSGTVHCCLAISAPAYAHRWAIYSKSPHCTERLHAKLPKWQTYPAPYTRCATVVMTLAAPRIMSPTKLGNCAAPALLA